MDAVEDWRFKRSVEPIRCSVSFLSYFSPMITHLSGPDFVYPARNSRLRQNQRVFFQKLDVVFHALLELSELKEVDVIDSLKFLVIRVRVLDDLTELGRSECDHATVGVVEDCNLPCAKKALRDNDGAKRVLAARPSENVGIRMEGVDIRATSGIANDVCVTLVNA